MLIIKMYLRITGPLCVLYKILLQPDMYHTIIYYLNRFWILPFTYLILFHFETRNMWCLTGALVQPDMLRLVQQGATFLQNYSSFPQVNSTCLIFHSAAPEHIISHKVPNVSTHTQTESLCVLLTKVSESLFNIFYRSQLLYRCCRPPITITSLIWVSLQFNSPMRNLHYTIATFQPWITLVTLNRRVCVT